MATIAKEMGTDMVVSSGFLRDTGGWFVLIHLNCSLSVIGAPGPAISLLFMPKTLEMNDMGSYMMSVSLLYVGLLLVAGSVTHKNHCHDSEHEKSDVLSLVVLPLPHGLPRLHNGDLLLLERDKIVQLYYYQLR